MNAEVHRRLGVLDDRAVTDVRADLPVAQIRRHGDVVEGPFADHRVGAHPEGCVVVREALVDQVLEVGGRPGDPLEAGGRSGEGAVGRLGDRDLAVLLLLEEVHEAQAVLRQEHAVGVQRQDEVGIGHAQVRRARLGGDERGTGDGLDLPVVVAHQPDVAVEVHGLVGLVRQGHVPLALEARELCLERPGQPPVQLPDARQRERRPLGRGLAQRGGDRGEVVDQPAEHLVGHERIAVIEDVLPRGQVLEPSRGGVVFARQALDGLAVDVAADGGGVLEGVQRLGEVRRRPRQQLFDLARQGFGRSQQLPGSGPARRGGIIDQEHHAKVRIFLQGGGEQGVADHPGVFLVGGDERGEAGGAALVEVVESGPGGPVVGARPVEEAEAAEEIRQRGNRQGGDDEEIDDRFDPRRGRRLGSAEQVLEHPRDDVGEPRDDRDDDRHPGHAQAAVADRRRDRRDRLGATVVAPLPSPADDPRLRQG